MRRQLEQRQFLRRLRMGIRGRRHPSSHLLTHVRNARISLLPVHAPSGFDEGARHGGVAGHTDRHRTTDSDSGPYNSSAITHTNRYARADPWIEPHAYCCPRCDPDPDHRSVADWRAANALGDSNGLTDTDCNPNPVRKPEAIAVALPYSLRNGARNGLAVSTRSEGTAPGRRMAENERRFRRRRAPSRYQPSPRCDIIRGF